MNRVAFISLDRKVLNSMSAVGALCLAFLSQGTAHAQAAQPAPVAAPAPATVAPATATPTATWQAPPPAEAPATTNTSTMNNNLTVFGAIGYGYGYGTGYGLGARYQIVLVPHMLHLPPDKHDELGLEFGMDWFHVSYDYSYIGASYDWSYNEFTPVVGVTWNFWLSDKLMLYPKVEFGYRIISWSNDFNNGYDPGLGHVYFQGTGGIAYAVGPVKLRAELGWASIRLGAAFALF